MLKIKCANQLISICIPTYNRSKYLHDTINSAIVQNDKHFEIIIVDDGSTDETKSIVNNFENEKIKYIYKEHTNSPDTRNRCINESNGEFILWLDSDDLLLPDLIERFREKLEQHPNIDVCYGDIQLIGDVNNIENKIINYKDYYDDNDDLLRKMMNGNQIPNPGTFIRKKLFSQIGYYNINYKRAHDYEFWTRAAKVALFKHIGGISLFWRWHDDNMSAGNKKLDTSYESSILTKLINTIDIKILFPHFDWSNCRFATFLANGEIAKSYLRWGDFYRCTKHLIIALRVWDTQSPYPSNQNLQLITLAKHYNQIFHQTNNPYFHDMSQLALNMSKITKNNVKN